MSRIEPVRVADLLRYGSRRLTEAGYPEPRHCHHLLAGMRNLSVASLLLQAREAVRPREREALEAGIARLLTGEPLAYISGQIGFRNLTLLTDPRALIPRPETETVVEVALGLAPVGVVADIGTGTGAIALALRQEGKFERVIGVDISGPTLDLARENGINSGLTVEWLEGDLLQPILSRGIALDLLVSNPPYLAEQEFAMLDSSVRDYEPAQALVSGSDGLDATRRLLAGGAEILRPGGWVVVEIDANRAEQCAWLAKQYGWTEIAVHQDLFGRPRILVARQGNQG